MNNKDNNDRLICVNCSADNPQNAREWFEKLMCDKDDQTNKKKQNEKVIEAGDKMYRFIPFKPGLSSGLFLITIIRIIGLVVDEEYGIERMKFGVKYAVNNTDYDEFLDDDVDYYLYDQSCR